MKANRCVFCVLVSVLLIDLGHALVEYSDEGESFRPQSSGVLRARKKSSRSKIKLEPSKRSVVRRRGAGHSPAKNGLFDLHLGMETVDIGSMGKANFATFEGLLQTPYNVFLSGSYRYAGGSLAGESSAGRGGNPRLLLGVNWLRFGGRQDAVTIDLYGGLHFGRRNSAFASTRTDKVVGVQTGKRFHQLAFGIGFEQCLSGTPEGKELVIGDIRKLAATLGWRVSGDILFSTEAGTSSILTDDDSLSREGARLERKVSFGYISPLLKLNISPALSLSLRAHFRTKKIPSDTAKKLLGAKLWHIEGLYGNSLGASLGLGF